MFKDVLSFNRVPANFHTRVGRFFRFILNLKFDVSLWLVFSFYRFLITSFLSKRALIPEPCKQLNLKLDFIWLKKEKLWSKV